MTTNTTALATRFRVELTDDLNLGGGWTQLVGINDFKPNINQNLVETSSYDNDGWESYEKTFQGWSAVATVWMRTVTGLLAPSIKMLQDRELLWGDACRIGVRWFDKNGLDEAYHGVAVVQTERGNTGVKDPETKTFTLQGDGILTKIANPGTAAAAPVVTSASPSDAAAGDQVVISGGGFTGASAVKFGSTNSSTFSVLSDSTIVAVVPTGSAGSAAITVTNPVGSSAAFPYTRGA